ncbi:MAG: complex I NDUFA9 subunit family protein [Methanosarcinales archaeon]
MSNNKKTKVFVTGGTGFVGKYVIEELLKNGFKLKCLVRLGSEKKLSKYKNIEITKGDITDYESLLNGMEECSAVINLVGIIREYKKKGITFEKLHFQATKNCVDAAKELKIQRFIQMSALGTRENAVAEYHKTKFKAEEYVKKSGLTYTIFRPSIIFGKEDKSINLFADIIKKFGFFIVFGDGKYKLQPVSVKNIAQGFAKTINNEKTYNKIFEICGPKSINFKELLDIIGNAVNKKVFKLHLPLFLAKPTIRLFGRFDFSPITYEQLIMLLEDNICDEKDFFNTFKIKPISLEQEIKNYLPAL